MKCGWIYPRDVYSYFHAFIHYYLRVNRNFKFLRGTSMEALLTIALTVGGEFTPALVYICCVLVEVELCCGTTNHYIIVWLLDFLLITLSV